jgi:excisionase family DNA binding protein
MLTCPAEVRFRNFGSVGVDGARLRIIRIIANVANRCKTSCVEVPMASTAFLIPEVPSDAEAVLAREIKEILAPLVGKNVPLDLRVMDLKSKATVKIPASAARLLVQILDEMSRGNAVKILPIQAELTTQQTADLLNISRPTLIQILEQGVIPYRKVGTHRRVPFAMAMEYKRKLEADRRAALAELVAYDQELGL